MDQTVFIVDDDLMVRDALGLLMASKGLRSAVFASAEDFLAVFDASWRGCLVSDLQLPGMSGLALQSALLEKSALLPVVMVTAHGDVASTRAALRAGALDFLEKPFDPEVLLDVVRNALRIDAQRSAASAEQREAGDKLGRLTVREREVMMHLSQGRSYRDIAEQLGISARTVEVYKARVMAKLQCASVTDLVRYALQSQSEHMETVKKI